VLSVDQFQGALAGLTMVEMEFSSADLMASFRGPDFADREVTEDRRYGASHLVRYGIPK
jgi:CYTH domain-containing protein